MNVAAHDRSEERRIARRVADLPVSPQGSLALRCPNLQGITPTVLRTRVHQLGPAAHLNRIGKHHYVATIGRRRFEGCLSEVNAQLQPLFNRFNIS
jgi:hypothetical protein